MGLLNIRIYPDPALKAVAQPVVEVTEKVRRLLDDMAETMYHAPGVGLAAPQVGVLQRILVVDVGEPVLMTQGERDPDQTIRPKLYQLINPEIVAREGQLTWEEGCLSLPELLVVMERSARVVVQAKDRDGQTVTIDAEGLLAVALQHEIDHLDGKLIIDPLSRLKRQLYLDKLRKLVPHSTERFCI
ncbi:MAG: peptide deformylase [Deltaproteobacteria bacterium]|nr:peptide deformylase [Deltaproteobacteria bacterium]